MGGSLVKSGIHDGVATITLNRPDKRNSLTREFILELTQAVRSATDSQGTRLLILAAEGPVFCAGMDLHQMEERASAANAGELWQLDTEAYRDLLVSLLTAKMPTLAVVGGPALAGGFGLVLTCDIVLAGDTAYFSLPEPKRGITAAVVVPLLVHRIGRGPATYALLSGRQLSAHDGFRLGLCHELAPPAELSSHTHELSLSVLSGAPAALELTKSQIARIGMDSLLAQIDDGMKTSAAARETGDAREGLNAFLQGRQPSWQSDAAPQTPDA